MSDEFVKVFVKADHAVNLAHPGNKVVLKERGTGYDWPNDQFTARRLADGDISIEPLHHTDPTQRSVVSTQNEGAENKNLSGASHPAAGNLPGKKRD